MRKNCLGSLGHGSQLHIILLPCFALLGLFPQIELPVPSHHQRTNGNQGTPPAIAPVDAKPGPLTTAPEPQHQVS